MNPKSPLVKNIRFGGVKIMLVGAIGGGLYIGYLINQAENHARRIVVYKPIIFIAISFVILGLLLAILGDRAKKLLQIDKNNLSLTNVIILLFLVALGIAGYIWVAGILNSMGYE